MDKDQLSESSCVLGAETTIQLREATEIETKSKIVDPIRDRDASQSHRSSPALISKLPPEVLCQIFRLCAPTPQNKTIALSHVCTQWRALAMSDPILWRSPIFTSPELAKAMLVRAQDVPLRVTVEMRRATYDLDDVDYTLVESALRSHVESAKLSNLSKPLLRWLRLLTRSSSNTLKHLSLTYPWIPRGKAFCDISAGPADFPNLQVLQLMNCRFPLWKSGQFNSLVMADIRFFGGETKMDMDTLSCLLRSSPNLETLVLVEAIGNTGTYPSAPSESQQRLYMHHLRQLQLRDTSSHLLCVLSVIQLPSIRELTIEVTSADSEDDKLRSLLQLVVDQSPSAIRDVQALSYRVLAQGGLDWKANFYPLTDISGARHLSVRILLTLQNARSPDWGRWPPILGGLFSLSRLERLTVEVSHTVAGLAQMVPFWLTLPSASLLHITTLGYGFVDFLFALVQVAAAADGSIHTHLPSLETVVISNGDMTRDVVVPDPMASTGNKETTKYTGLRFLDLALKVLEKRGFVVPHIILSGCSVLAPACQVIKDTTRFKFEVFDEHVVATRVRGSGELKRSRLES